MPQRYEKPLIAQLMTDQALREMTLRYLSRTPKVDRGRAHDISWRLRAFVGGSADAELFETTAKGIGVHVESLRRARGPVDHPV